jgi:hypothetical protein
MTAKVTGTIAGALRVLTRDREAEGANECSMREPKSVQEVYKEKTYQTLLRRFCNVARPEDVERI